MNNERKERFIQKLEYGPVSEHPIFFKKTIQGVKDFKQVLKENGYKLKDKALFKDTKVVGNILINKSGIFISLNEKD